MNTPRRDCIHVRLDADLKRALAMRAFTLGVSVNSLVVAAIDRSLLGSGKAAKVREDLAPLLEMDPRNHRALELDIGSILAGHAGPLRDTIATVAIAIENSPLVLEVYGTEAEMRRIIRRALAADEGGDA
jgi:plasmid stability protein